MSAWVLQLICCGHDDGSEAFGTWEEADAFRQSYVDAQGHVRSAILSVAPRTEP